MPILDIYRLTFRDGLHVGFHGIGQENTLSHIPSDSLFAALAVTRANLHGDAGPWIDQFTKAEPPIRLSSAFPFAGDVRFYPRPPERPASMDLKDWDRIRFVSEGILQGLLKNTLPEENLPQGLDKEPRTGLALQNGQLWLKSDEAMRLPPGLREKKKLDGTPIPLSLKVVQRQRVWQESTIPRVTVDRISNTSEIFHTGRIQFSQGCGLWFGVEWNDRNQVQDLEELLSLLGDAGLGAERSIGYGAFQFERMKQAVAWDNPRPDGRLYLLSRYHPRDAKDAESLLKHAYYDLVVVSGRVQTAGVANQRRRSARLVAEGSLVGGAAQGGLVDVQPTVQPFPHPVYRYGLALGIGVEAPDG